MWLLVTIVGTAVLIAAAGDDRCFFTALFTCLLTGGLVAAMTYRHIYIEHGSLTREDMVEMSAVFAVFVVVPVAVAWLVTVIVGCKRGRANLTKRCESYS